jgi:hypothetical protein
MNYRVSTGSVGSALLTGFVIFGVLIQELLDYTDTRRQANVLCSFVVE